MPIALTCDCGARFDLDEGLSGQKVNCPECLQPLEVPTATTAAPPRTSLLALVSIVLALSGAFTLIGTAAAVLCGIAALVQIHQQRDRLQGSGLAMAGIVVGCACTALTIFLLLRPDLVPIDSWIRQRTMAGQIDTTGALETLTRDGNITLTRPSREWGRAQADHSDDPVVGDLQQHRDLLLVNVTQHAFIDVSRASSSEEPGDLVLNDLMQPRSSVLGEDGDIPLGAAPLEVPRAVVPVRHLDPVDGWDGSEWLYDLNRGGQKWRFLIRAYKKPSDPPGKDPIYVIRGYAPVRRFEAVAEELRKTMDSIQLPK